MIRKVIRIDEEKCNGCGLCAGACQEGAIKIVNGKAKLIREDYCDGLGNCLPACPTGAISFEEREAAAFDEAAVKASKAANPVHPPVTPEAHTGCPGMRARTIETNKTPEEVPAAAPVSHLKQWPVQIKLVPVNAPYFHNANLLIAADCAAYACGDFHSRFMKNHITVIGCPKLDGVDYTDKLRTILQNNEIKSVTVARMEVPCCGGLANAAIEALRTCGKMIPWKVVIFGVDGREISE